MTENGNKQASNGDAKVDLTDVEKNVVKQISYYFGDFNLPRDKFLQETVKEDDGWVSIETMLKFQRLSKLSEDGGFILDALAKADEGLIEVDKEGKKIRRSPDMPLPPSEEDSARIEKTVYVKGFEKEETTLDQLLEFFSQFDKVVNVQKRTWKDNKDGSRHFKGSTFVTFTDKAAAEDFMKVESVKAPHNKEEELVRKWQKEYFEEKKKEYEEKKSKNRSAKNAIKKSKEDENDEEKEEQEKESSLPKGAVIFMDGFADDIMREDIKEKLKADFGQAPEEIAFIDYEKGQSSGYIRFKEEGAGVKLAAKMKVKLEEAKFKVKDSQVTYKVLEGDEETAFLDKSLKSIMDRKGRNKGHKRRGGFRGGRGGKRQRT